MTTPFCGKHVLIIPCSDKKANKALPAYQLYQGALMSIINNCDVDSVLSRFDLFFLSAKYGLIGSHTVIEPYNKKMPSQPKAIEEFVKDNKRKSRKLLSTYASKNVYLFTVLSKDYQAAFDGLFNEAYLKRFACTYRSLNARGIGDHRSRLKSIITTHDTPPPVLYRSGVANEPEFCGFRAAGESIGSSLAFMKNKGVQQHLINTIKSGDPVFLDNGLVSAVTKGKALSNKDVFDQYISLVRGLKNTKNLSIVVPDNPLDQNAALQTLIDYKKEIRWLSTRANVVVAMHKPVQRSVKAQLDKVMAVLGKTKVTVGIPCRQKGDLDWRLPLTDIETIFSAKNADNSPCFSRVHFFALSEVSGKGRTYQERIMLSQMYNKEVFADCCRITAVFGNSETTNRKGAIATRKVTAELTKLNTIRSKQFQSYTSDSEWDSTSLFDEINSLSAQQKAALWNECYPKMMAIDISGSDDDIEEVFDNLTNAYFADFISNAKKVLYSLFTLPSHAPDFSTKRAAAIVECFKEDTASQIPVQHVMGF